MKRRDLLTGLAVGSAFAASNGCLWQVAENTDPGTYGDGALPGADGYLDEADSDLNGTAIDRVISDRETPLAESTEIVDRVRFFESAFSDDISLPEVDRPLLESVNLRLGRVQQVVGHGNFNILDFDQALAYARGYRSVGAFTRPELDFIERIFFSKASDYGFCGTKVTSELTASISRSDTIKVPYSGHFLFKDSSLNYYEQLKSDIGPSIILTSGIRSNVKQLHLFLAKAAASQYNLSKASRSLAPPGHSYHGVGDFDVGRVGWGALNFTRKFAESDEFKRMQDLGYVQIRYTENNRLGVRFEPWHIKVV